MAEAPGRRLRVVQWATGNIGARSLRGVIEHPGLELVGVYVTPGYTANRAVNAVPVVCAAPPGIRTTPDLPQVIARLA